MPVASTQSMQQTASRVKGMNVVRIEMSGVCSVRSTVTRQSGKNGDGDYVINGTLFASLTRTCGHDTPLICSTDKPLFAKLCDPIKLCYPTRYPGLLNAK